MASTPYEGATSGASARDEIVKILKKYGCASVGFMDDFETHALILQFSYRGRRIELRANAQGWANLYLRENPWSRRRHTDKCHYEVQALAQGVIAVNSILRDWIKGQITAIETGILTFDHVFLPHMLTHDGRTVIEALKDTDLLPGPEVKER